MTVEAELRKLDAVRYNSSKCSIFVFLRACRLPADDTTSTGRVIVRIN